MEIKVDMGDVLRLADQLGVAAREIPYSMSRRGVYVGKGGRLELVFAFKPRIEMKADVPFFETFETEVRKRFWDKLPEWLIRSLRTRR
jgi:hypothetical protein